MSRKNVFVLGLDHVNREMLEDIPAASECTFHGILEPEEVLGRENYPIEELLAKAKWEIDHTGASVDAIVGYWDFPVSDMLPLIRREYDLPSPSLESVLKCGHKYWSRVVQREAVPDAVPDFARFDPFDDHALESMRLDFPFWIKPIKSFSSYLGFRIRNEDEFHRAVDIIRRNVSRLATPFFNYLLQQADVPDWVRDEGQGRSLCMAEKLIGGRQVTIEGYTWNGEVRSYGLVDSIRESNRSSFARYQYPSQLPRKAQDRMKEVATELMSHVGYDGGPFNLELFWDKAKDKVWVLEINNRISQSHCEIFRKVDGSSHQQVMVDLGLGREPRMPHRKGKSGVAAKLFLRHYGDTLVHRVPTYGEIDAVKKEFPDAYVQILPQEGRRLSELMDQDSYSYVLAIIYLGGRDQKDLLKRYERVVEMLPFRFEDLERPDVTVQPVL